MTASELPQTPDRTQAMFVIERALHWTRYVDCLWARLYEDVEGLRQAVIEFTRRYNNEWLIERHGHCTPSGAYANAMEGKAA